MITICAELLIVFGLTACGYINAPSDNEAQDRRLDYLQAQINVLFARIQEDKTTIEQLTQQLVQLANRPTPSVEEVNLLSQQIAAIQQSVTNQQTTINMLIEAPPSTTVVQLCPGTPTHTVFIETALCINGELQGVYSQNGGFLTKLTPGAYTSSGIGSACNFTITGGCNVTVN